ncbi:hypothetical protein F5B20DRAFT_587861 [Whalleya microplaca]|nr:hypothetical protein F5B20DRAFT_587861 [Whalleya microplaca]
MNEPVDAVKKICHEHITGGLKNLKISKASDPPPNADGKQILAWKIQQLENEVSSLDASIAATVTVRDIVDSVVKDLEGGEPKPKPILTNHTSPSHPDHSTRAAKPKMPKPKPKHEDLIAEIEDLDFSLPPSIEMEDAPIEYQPISSRLRSRTALSVPTGPANPGNKRPVTKGKPAGPRVIAKTGITKPAVILPSVRRDICGPYFATTEEQDEDIERIPKSDAGSVRVVIRQNGKAKGYGIKMSKTDNEISEPHLVFFADGSFGKGGGKYGGAGVTYRRSQDECDIWTEIAHGIVGITNADAAELLAIGVALENALQEVLSFSPKSVQEGQRRLPAIIILTDSQTSLVAIGSFLRGVSPRSSLGSESLATILQPLHCLGEQGVQVTFHWVPGHSAVPGNCIADQLAGDGSVGARFHNPDLKENEQYNMFLVSRKTLNPNSMQLKRKRTQSPSPERRERKKPLLSPSDKRGRLGSPRKPTAEIVKIEQEEDNGNVLTRGEETTNLAPGHNEDSWMEVDDYDDVIFLSERKVDEAEAHEQVPGQS